MSDITAPDAPYALMLTLSSSILSREMDLVFTARAMAYLQYDSEVPGATPKWRCYSAQDYTNVDEFLEAMNDFFRRLETAGWETHVTHRPFFVDLEPDWMDDLRNKKVHHKIRDAFTKYRQSRVDTGAEGVVV
jgi:hypothetical protein